MAISHLARVIVAFAAATGGGGMSRAYGETSAATPVSGPRIHFAAPTADLGKLIAGTLVNHDYVFSNTGTGPLTITAVYPSCGCTTIGRWPARLEPGQTGAIPIQFDSRGFTGEISKWIIVSSDDPNQPNTKLTIKGVVGDPIAVFPASAVFTPLAGTLASETKIIRITNQTDEPLQLQPPESTQPVFAAELKTVRPEKEFELRIRTIPPFGAGPIRGTISIKTNSSAVPTIAITALLVVQPPVTVFPAEIRLGQLPSPTKREVRITVRNNSPATPLTILTSTVDLPAVTTDVSEVEVGRVSNVLLTFPAGFQLPPGDHARLTLRTNHPHVPVISVPIHPDPLHNLIDADPRTGDATGVAKSPATTPPTPVSVKE